MIKDKTRGSEREVGFANRLIEDDGESERRYGRMAGYDAVGIN